MELDEQQQQPQPQQEKRGGEGRARKREVMPDPSTLRTKIKRRKRELGGLGRWARRESGGEVDAFVGTLYQDGQAGGATEDEDRGG